MSRIATRGPNKAVGLTIGLYFGIETRDTRLHCTTVVFYSPFPKSLIGFHGRMGEASSGSAMRGIAFQRFFFLLCGD